MRNGDCYRFYSKSLPFLRFSWVCQVICMYVAIIGFIAAGPADASTKPKMGRSVKVAEGAVPCLDGRGDRLKTSLAATLEHAEDQLKNMSFEVEGLDLKVLRSLRTSLKSSLTRLEQSANRQALRSLETSLTQTLLAAEALTTLKTICDTDPKDPDALHITRLEAEAALNTRMGISVLKCELSARFHAAMLHQEYEVLAQLACSSHPLVAYAQPPARHKKHVLVYCMTCFLNELMLSILLRTFFLIERRHTKEHRKS